MKKLIAVLILATGAMLAQNTGQNVVNNSLFKARVVAPGTPFLVTTPTLQNIGQTSHEVRIVGSGFSGTFWQVGGGIQASLDGTNWFYISSLQTQFMFFNGSISIGAIRPYPYLRALLTISTTGSNVTVTGLYIGTSSPTVVTPNSTGPIPWIQDNFQFSRFEGVSWGTGESKKLFTCANAGFAPAVYGLTISNTGGADTLVSFHAKGQTSSTDITFWAAFVSNGQTLVLPNAQRAYGVSGGFGLELVDFNIQSSAATTMYVTPVMRCE